VWVLEVGASSFGSEEVQAFGLLKSLDLLHRKSERIHWNGLYDLPLSWPAETRRTEAEDSADYRHYYLGLQKADGTPKLAADLFPSNGSVGLCQWFQFEDPRLYDAVQWMKRHGVRYLRTGLSWADWFRPNAEAWFDRLIEALRPFDVALTLCFTPSHLGVESHPASPPRDIHRFAEFAAWAVDRYAPGPRSTKVSPSRKGAVLASATRQ
jgi:beta-xylosidase